MDKASCPSCGTRFPGMDVSVCPECGKPLGDASPTTPMGPETSPMDGGVREFTDVPERIGPYKILKLIGEGGMGAVYLAEQHEPVHRKVALKLIKAGMDTGQFVARFESERQALALMNHPTIAKVLDGGATPEGRPYFVMEFIDGVPITQYCDDNKLGMRERLDLFLSVCDGVQHAHHKGIIHRDLKPSNVLVEVQDGNPIPKIIDFGVAKATDQRLTELTLYTDLGMMVGTPEYMSPEQADMTALDIDTRTDVYSLGVLLYELLTGSLPFTTQELREAGFEGMRQKIREVDPPKPSTRVSRMGPDTEAVAANRNLKTGELSHRLRGDLDWITVRSMEKERSRRYGSPADLAADLKRYLTDEPVEASPPSRAYRTKKFVRRHKVGVVAASLVTLAVILGMVGTTVGLVRARKAEAVAKEAEQVATDEAAAANEVSDFLVGLFEQANPWEAQSDTMRVRDVLDRGAERIETTLEDQPLLKARMLTAIGDAYAKLGLNHKALNHLEQSLALREEHLDPKDPLIATSLWEVATILFGLRGADEEHLAKAKAYADRARAIREEVLPPDHLELGDTYYGFGLYHNLLAGAQQGEAREEHLKEAERLLRESVRIGDANANPAVNARGWLGVVLMQLGQLDEAEAVILEGIRLKEEAGGEAITLRSSLARIYRDTGQPEKGIPHYQVVLRIKERALGPHHPSLNFELQSLDYAYELAGDTDSALVYVEWQIAAAENHPEARGNRTTPLFRAAGLHARRGEFDLALPYFRSAWQEVQEGGPDTKGSFFKHWGIELTPQERAEDLNNMAELLRRMGLNSEAAKHEAEARRLLEEAEAETN